MHIFPDILVSACWLVFVSAYRNQLFTIAKLNEGRTREYKCMVYEGIKPSGEIQGEVKDSSRRTAQLTSTPDPSETANPFELYQNYLHKFLYGDNIEIDEQTKTETKLTWKNKSKTSFNHYVVGNYMRSELFNNRIGVHLPLMEFIHRGYCELKITKDYMQTAVNAFAIFLYGTLDDIERLPADYVLRSARTISMMKIAREKLAATWDVVKAGRETRDISHFTLEKYRPLFKYINGREIARLNLTDDRILTYIGTHADLDRHQVGVVASRYIELNKDWSSPRYLNIMNNLLCGVPMTFMRRLPVNTYLQLSHQALGKSFSWNARDVSRLGLLLTEVEGTDLSAINPEAIAGITAQVMLRMSPQSLQYFTENQLKYLAPKPFNILNRKLRAYSDQLHLYNSAFQRQFYMLKSNILNIMLLFLY